MPARTAHLSHRVKAKVEKRPDSLPESPDAAYISFSTLKLTSSTGFPISAGVTQGLRGSSICDHRRVKSQCKDCGGSSICEHGRRKKECKECKGSTTRSYHRRIGKFRDASPAPESVYSFASTPRTRSSRSSTAGTAADRTAEYFAKFWDSGTQIPLKAWSTSKEKSSRQFSLYEIFLRSKKLFNLKPTV